VASEPAENRKSLLQRMLDLVERVGNRVPHPVLIFLTLILLVIGLSHVLYLSGASVSYDVVNVETHEIERVTTKARSLLTADGVVLIPLAGAAYTSLGRHPLAGIALGFAAVAGAFNVNMLIKPLDA
jgi:aminobenzoyl-glutamate transport protein